MSTEGHDSVLHRSGERSDERAMRRGWAAVGSPAGCPPARRVTRGAALPGLGTVINVVAVVIGALLGMAIGHRLPERTRSVVTDCLGLVTLLVAGLSCVSVTDPSLASAAGPGAPVLIVLGSLLVGSVVGSLLRIEERLSGLAGAIQTAWPAHEVAGRSERRTTPTPRGNGSSRGG